MGRGGLHLGEMRMWDWPDPVPHQQALRARRKTKGQSAPDSLGVWRPQACPRPLLSEPRPWHPARSPEAVLTERAAEDAPSNRAGERLLGGRAPTALPAPVRPQRSGPRKEPGPRTSTGRREKATGCPGGHSGVKEAHKPPPPPILSPQTCRFPRAAWPPRPARPPSSTILPVPP